MSWLLLGLVLQVAIPCEAQTVTVTGNIPYSDMLLGRGGKLHVWSMSDVRVDKDYTVNPGGNSIMEKDSRSRSWNLGYQSKEVEPTEEVKPKPFKGTLDMTHTKLPAIIAILVDDKATLTVKENINARLPGVTGPAFTQTYTVDGTALWNPKSYKEFIESDKIIPAGRKYTLTLNYANIANLTKRYGGKTDVDGVSVYVCLMPLEIESETVATLPNNRTRKTIGVGEAVNLHLNVPDFITDTWTWSMSPESGGGEMVMKVGDQKNAQYLAPSVAANPTIKVKFDHGGEAEVKLTVIPPSGLEFFKEGREDARVYANKPSGKAIGMELHPAFYLLPNTVNFENVRTYEGQATPKRKGYFLNRDYSEHTANGPHELVKYIDGKGNRGNGLATLDYDMFQASTHGPTHADGRIEWKCKWEYDVFREGQVVGTKSKITDVTMSLELTKTATDIKAEIQKGIAKHEHTFPLTELEE